MFGKMCSKFISFNKIRISSLFFLMVLYRLSNSLTPNMDIFWGINLEIFILEKFSTPNDHNALYGNGS